MKKLKHVLAMVILMFSVAQSSAQSIQTPSQETVEQKNLNTIKGVWQASVNKEKVFVCWMNPGAYAYNTKNPDVLIELSPQEKSDALEWLWNDPSGVDVISKPFMHLKKIDAKQMVADIQYGVKHSAPVVFKQLKTSNITGDCLFDDFDSKPSTLSMYKAFNAPRASKLKTWQSESRFFMGKEYRINNAKSKTVGEVSAIELLSDEQDVSAVNKALASDFVANQYSLATCGEVSTGGDYHSHQKLRYWGRDWVSLSFHSDGYCGGAHPFFNADIQTFNLATGKSEEIWQWFKLTTLDKNSMPEEDAKLVCRLKEHKKEYITQCLPRNLAKKIYSARDICDGRCGSPSEPLSGFNEMADGHHYSASLGPRGVIFLPHLVEPARGFRTYFGHYVIPYAELKPYLSKKGREEVDKILESGE